MTTPDSGAFTPLRRTPRLFPTILLACVLAFSLTACGGQSPSGSSSGNSSGNPSGDNGNAGGGNSGNPDGMGGGSGGDSGGGSDGGGSGGMNGNDLPTSRFAMAGGCFGLKALASDGFVTPAGAGYSTNAADSSSAEAFFFQPATLGKYLLYTSIETLLTPANDSSVGSSSIPSDNAIFTIDFDDSDNSFSLTSDGTGQALNVDSSGTLITSNTAGKFSIIPTLKTCAEYPEIATNVRGSTFKGNGVDEPILGFADVHTHMGMSSEMSYAGDVGPSAGGALYGEIFHRFGVAHALGNCQDFHGPNGTKDGNNILATNPTGMHDTIGWPTFVDWPARDFLTHQVMYYRWVERAYLSGLRLMVNHGTNIAALCRIGAMYSGMPDADCNDMSVAIKQIEYLYEMQDYVDARSGGPGKGWFRIAKSPLEARQIINDGNMAVVLGVEVAQVLNCGVTFVANTGQEIRNCDEAQIDAEIQQLWDLGVRHVYPYHDIDSSLGGTGIFSENVINYLNFLDTGAFWKTEECRDFPEDEPSVREPGAAQTTSIPQSGMDPISMAFFQAAEGALPTYPPGKRCNSRHVTDLGRYALNALMDRKMIIDIDHAAYASKDIMLDIAAARTPPYPMASSHDAHGGLTSDQAVRMLKAGGTIYPYKGTGVKHRDFLEKLKFWHNKAGTLQSADVEGVVTNQVLGLGYGADGNGFGGHPGPRGGDSEAITYPIKLFEGSDWGPEFDDIEPLFIDLSSIEQSGKFWHIDEVGMAHYGMVADFVEEVRLESGEEGLRALFNSAEAFVQMWERVENRD